MAVVVAILTGYAFVQAHESTPTTGSKFTTLSPESAIRSYVLGDSVVEGYGSTSRDGAFAYQLGDALGWEGTVDGDGGTGFVNDGGAEFKAKYHTRALVRHVPELIAEKPEVVVIASGRNDSYYPVAQVEPSITAAFRKIKAALPSAKVFVVGPWCWPDATRDAANCDRVAKITDAERRIAADTGFPFIDPAKLHIFTKSNEGAYIGPDGFHPTQAGYDHLAKVLTRELLKVHVPRIHRTCPADPSDLTDTRRVDCVKNWLAGKG